MFLKPRDEYVQQWMPCQKTENDASYSQTKLPIIPNKELFKV